MRTIRFRTTQYLVVEYIVQVDDDERITEGEIIVDLNGWTGRSVDVDFIETSEEFIARSLKEGDADPRRLQKQTQQRARRDVARRAKNG